MRLYTDIQVRIKHVDVIYHPIIKITVFILDHRADTDSCDDVCQILLNFSDQTKFFHFLFIIFMTDDFLTEGSKVELVFRAPSAGRTGLVLSVCSAGLRHSFSSWMNTLTECL